MKIGKRWIGVDFDRTIASGVSHDTKVIGGTPIIPMLARVKRWIAEGKTVKIFTARVSPHPHLSWHRPEKIAEKIQDWLVRECGLPRLEVTCIKDSLCECIWDDKAVTVERDTGKLLTDGNIEIIEAGSDWQRKPKQKIKSTLQPKV